MRNPNPKQPIFITITSQGNRSIVVIAKCTRCGLAACRLVDESETNLAAVVGAEALAAQGCAHVDAVTLTHRKTMA
jgi:hypothetical protein